MQIIVDPVVGQLELLGSVGSWQRPFDLPGFPPAELHLETDVLVGVAGSDIFRWSLPSAGQQAIFAAIEGNAAFVSERCVTFLAAHAASVGAVASTPPLGPKIVIGIEGETAAIHFAVPWEPEHGCTLAFDGQTMSALE